MPSTPCPPEAGAASALRLAVPNAPAAVEAARLAVHAHLAQLGEQALPPALIYRLELILEETLMNRLWHAWPDGGTHHTELTLALCADALWLRFEDDGLAFDPLQAAPHLPAASLAEAQPGGLGLLLTRKAATSCCYERVGIEPGGINRLTLTLARTPQG